MGCDSLALVDIWQLIIICAIIFIPLGYFMRKIAENTYVFYYLIRKPSNLKKIGLLSDLNKAKK